MKNTFSEGNVFLINILFLSVIFCGSSLSLTDTLMKMKGSPHVCILTLRSKPRIWGRIVPLVEQYISLAV